MKKYILFVLISIGLSMTLALNKTSAVTMTFEEAYDITSQRHSHGLAYVQCLEPKRDEWFGSNSNRIEWFLGEANNFNQLYSLDLTRQNIDDSFIEKLSEDGFRRIKSINLTGNPQITYNSLQFILNSDTLGSMRELLQTSGRYGRPSSEIEIRVGGTRITKEEADNFNRNPRFNFTIHYWRAVDNVQLSPSVDGIKLLKVFGATQQETSLYSRGATGASGAAYMGPQGSYPWGVTGPAYMGPQGPNPYPLPPTGATGLGYIPGSNPYLGGSTGATGYYPGNANSHQ